MKKIICLALSVLMLISLCACKDDKKPDTTSKPAVDVFANPTSANSFKYDFNEDKTEVHITEYIGTEVNVVIPREIEGIKVAKIYKFYGMEGITTDIESVAIPETVDLIFNSVFSGYDKLHTVILSEGLKEIGNMAFYNCVALKNINLPQGVETIGKDAFFGCSSLETITIPASLSDKYMMSSFRGCGLKEIKFEDGIKVIGGYATFWCENLKNVTIPASVENIKEYTFDQYLESATFLGDAPKEVGKAAFGDNATIYYDPATSGWDTTKLKEEYNVLPIGSKKPEDNPKVDTSKIEKKQYLTHADDEIFDWKCDIAPSKIKVFEGCPIDAFFITTDNELYEYNAQEAFANGKNYRKVNYDIKILRIDYHYQLNRLSVLTEDYKTYTYDKQNDKFVDANNAFDSVVKDFSTRGTILSWGYGTMGTTFWFMDKKGEVSFISQTEGTEYSQRAMGKMPTDEKIIYSTASTIKTDNGYYCFSDKKNSYVLSEEATAASDNIAFLSDIIVLYKDDPTHIYDHTLVYSGKFKYY